MLELNQTQTEAGYSAEKITMRRVKGWPEKSPNPYRLYRAGKFLAAFPTVLGMVRNINKRMATETPT